LLVREVDHAGGIPVGRGRVVRHGDEGAPHADRARTDRDLEEVPGVLRGLCGREGEETAGEREERNEKSGGPGSGWARHAEASEVKSDRKCARAYERVFSAVNRPGGRLVRGHARIAERP